MSPNGSSYCIAILAAAALGACSPSQLAADLVGSAIAGGGDVYASDDDPELVLEALPFGLKTIEGLLAQSPGNVALRLAAARGFAAYAHLLRETAPEVDRAAARELDTRSARLFLRGRDHAMQGLEARHPGFAKALGQDHGAALARVQPQDAGLLYWAGAAWFGAIAADKRDLSLVVGLPHAAAMIEHAAALDEAVEDGAAHELLMLYEAGRPGGSLEAAEAHYRRAIKLSRETSAGAHVGYADTIAVARQDRAAFERALALALAIEPNAAPERLLTNTLAQRRARRLLEEADLLFLPQEGGTS